MKMAGRTSGAGAYRFGYQGQFAEDETEQTGYNAFELRLWDARIGRWTSPDPYGQYFSSYSGMGNNPLNKLDPDGGFDWPWAKKTKQAPVMNDDFSYLGVQHSDAIVTASFDGSSFLQKIAIWDVHKFGWTLTSENFGFGAACNLAFNGIWGGTINVDAIAIAFNNLGRTQIGIPKKTEEIANLAKDVINTFSEEIPVNKPNLATSTEASQVSEHVKKQSEAALSIIHVQSYEKIKKIPYLKDSIINYKTDSAKLFRVWSDSTMMREWKAGGTWTRVK